MIRASLHNNSVWLHGIRAKLAGVAYLSCLWISLFTFTCALLDGIVWFKWTICSVYLICLKQGYEKEGIRF